jgi:hypothetical protein
MITHYRGTYPEIWSIPIDKRDNSLWMEDPGELPEFIAFMFGILKFDLLEFVEGCRKI